jgi:hypothetical protein
MNVPPPPNYTAPQDAQNPQSQQMMYPQINPMQEPEYQTQSLVEQQPMHQQFVQSTHQQVVQHPIHHSVQPVLAQQHGHQQVVPQPTYQPVIQQPTHQQVIQQPIHQPGHQQVVPQPMHQQVVNVNVPSVSPHGDRAPLIHSQPGQRHNWHNFIFVSLNGFVLAFETATHQMVWKTSLSGVGWNQTR